MSESKPKSEMKINPFAGIAKDEQPIKNPFELPKVAPGVIPERNKMACDQAVTSVYNYAVSDAFSEGLGFLGYPYLSELAQRPEYRRASEIISKEMTRKWLTIISTGDEAIDDKSDKIKEIEAEFKRLNVKEVFYKVIEQDGLFGRGQIYLDTGATDKPDELVTPLSESASKIGIGTLKRLVPVESMWTYPNAYNATDPLKPDYFVPQEWYVMGKRVHASRLMFFVFRQVPDILKPAYVFGGLALSQMMKPYVDNWLRTRQSVSDLVHSFSVSGLKTNLSGILNGGASDMLSLRAQLFNQGRDNRGLMLVDADTEEFFNVSTPLSTLDQLQAQSQEQMSAVTGIPLVKLLGITPSGLNASSDGEIRAFYDWIESQQEANLTPHMNRLMNIIQLSLFGEIDPEISFKWNPLWSMNETEAAAVRQTDATTDSIYINSGVISPEEVRTRIASNIDSPYASLDLDDNAIELPDEEDDLPVLKSRST